MVTSSELNEKVSDYELLRPLWNFLNFSLSSKRRKWFDFIYSFCFIFWMSITCLTYKIYSNETQLRRATIMIPLIFLQPALAVIVVHRLNFYNYISRMREEFLKQLHDMDEFPLRKYRKLAEESRKFCYTGCITLGVLNTLSYSMFHPMIGDHTNLFTNYFIQHYGYLTHIISSIAVLPLMYAQLFPIYNLSYIAWSCRIHSIRLEEYIETNLCKKYENFEIIQSKEEQNLVYRHLKRCTQLHLLLKGFLHQTERIHMVHILLFCPLGVLSFVSGSFYLIENLNPSDNYRVVMAVITISLVFTGFCYNGQEISDMSERINSSLCSSSWIYWNTRNRKYLLTLLINTAEPVKVNMADLVILNFKTILDSVKLCYSLLTMALNLRSRSAA